MAFRTLLLHADDTAAGGERMTVAAALARRFSAKLIGLAAYGYPLPDPRDTHYDLARAWADEALQRAHEAFGAVESEVPEAEWRSVFAPPARALVEAACGADLIVASRTAEATIPERFASPDELVLAAGLPVLLVPPDAPALEAHRIVVGWKNTRESRRVITDARPFLLAAEQVDLVSVSPDGRPDESLPAAAARLAQHGVKVAAEQRDASGELVADALRGKAADAGADLIVTGGYGRSRIRELFLGGVTRELLHDCPTYLLMSH